MAMPEKPAFLIHTGDITHLSKPEQFDTAAQLLGGTKLTTYTVPGEHDILEDEGKSYLNHFGRGTHGDGWYSFNAHGVHFIGLVNVVNLKGNGLGDLGHEQLEWLESDVKSCPPAPRSWCSRMSRYGSSTGIGAGARWRRASAELPQAFRVRDGAERTYPSGDAEGRGACGIPYRAIHGLSAGGPGRREGSRPDARAGRRTEDLSGDDQNHLVTAKTPLAIVDTPLAG